MFNSNLNRSNNERKIKGVKKRLYVKYMVCLRDKMALKSLINEQDMKCTISVHGAIECFEDITQDRLQELKSRLSKSGLILLDEEESKLIDRIINTIIEIVHYSDSLPKLNFKDIINQQAVSGEESILKIFSDVKGMSVLQFIIIQKIERAKELMLYDDMPIEEIAETLNYKNKDYLVAQFKKTTGLTPDYFKRLRGERNRITEKNYNSSSSDAAGASS